MILSKPGQQVIVIYFSFHIILSRSYILQDAAGVKRLLLEACRLSQDLVAQDPAVTINVQAKLQTYFTCIQASNHASVIYIFKTNQLDRR